MPATLAPSLTPPPVIDPGHLDRVTFHDLAFRNEVLTLFVREAQALAGRLAGATGDSDWRVAAHTLKGMARGIGAARLATAAEQAEGAGRSSDPGRLAPLIAEAVIEAQRFLSDG